MKQSYMRHIVADPGEKSSPKETGDIMAHSPFPFRRKSPPTPIPALTVFLPGTGKLCKRQKRVCSFFSREKAAERALSSRQNSLLFLNFCPVTILHFSLRNRMKRALRRQFKKLTSIPSWQIFVKRVYCYIYRPASDQRRECPYAAAQTIQARRRRDHPFLV